MLLISKMIQLNKPTVAEICNAIAQKVKHRRLELNLTQVALAQRSGVNIETYRKFERTGQISFQNLVKIGFAFDMTTDFNLLFSQRQYERLDDVLAENTTRKRGKKQ